MSETITYRSKYFGERHTALMIVRSLAIWVTTLGMLAMMAAPAYFWGKDLSSTTIFTALFLLAMAQGCQALTLYLWTRPDVRQVIWDPNSLILTTCGYRLAKQFWSFGSIHSQLQIDLKDIREVTLHQGRGKFLQLKTRSGVIQISNDLQDLKDFAELIMNLVQSPPVPASEGDDRETPTST